MRDPRVGGRAARKGTKVGGREKRRKDRILRLGILFSDCGQGRRKEPLVVTCRAASGLVAPSPTCSSSSFVTALQHAGALPQAWYEALQALMQPGVHEQYEAGISDGTCAAPMGRFVMSGARCRCSFGGRAWGEQPCDATILGQATKKLWDKVRDTRFLLAYRGSSVCLKVATKGVAPQHPFISGSQAVKHTPALGRDCSERCSCLVWVACLPSRAGSSAPCSQQGELPAVAQGQQRQWPCLIERVENAKAIAHRQFKNGRPRLRPFSPNPSHWPKDRLQGPPWMPDTLARRTEARHGIQVLPCLALVNPEPHITAGHLGAGVQMPHELSRRTCTASHCRVTGVATARAPVCQTLLPQLSIACPYCRPFFACRSEGSLPHGVKPSTSVEWHLEVKVSSNGTRSTPRVSCYRFPPPSKLSVLSYRPLFTQRCHLLLHSNLSPGGTPEGRLWKTRWRADRLGLIMESQDMDSRPETTLAAK